MKSVLEFPANRNSQIEQAKLLFLSEWNNLQHGNIYPGEKLIIEYYPGRLSKCRTNFRGALFGDIEIYIKFHPGGHFYSGSVMKKIRSDGDNGMVVGLEPKKYEILVPKDANEIELWFRGFYQTTSSCEEWDSQYGKNYWYQVVHE